MYIYIYTHILIIFIYNLGTHIFGSSAPPLNDEKIQPPLWAQIRFVAAWRWAAAVCFVASKKRTKKQRTNSPITPVILRCADITTERILEKVSMCHEQLSWKLETYNEFSYQVLKHVMEFLISQIFSAFFILYLYYIFIGPKRHSVLTCYVFHSWPRLRTR